jgi:2-polyprenyl-6-methoxyphenol hydroxylase-like FAD-dependent oxidoreductase
LSSQRTESDRVGVVTKISAPGRVGIIGGGPAGLFLARMIGLSSPRTIVDVYERYRPEDVFGFGVGLSDRAMHEISAHDSDTHRRIAEASARVAAIELRPPGATLRYDGFGLSAVARDRLLTILREQAAEVGARLHFRHDASVADLDADVIVIAEGASSATRAVGRDAFGTTIQAGTARYIWLGTPARFNDAATMSFVQTDYGPIAAHSYPHSAGMSTVVVETDESTWRKTGLDRQGVDGIGTEALGLLSDIFAEHLAGQPLVSNHSRWGNFKVVRNERWSNGNTVLIGDAAHTAHFTVGSGTKMALEDGIALAGALRRHDDLTTAFAAYERDRRPPVALVQRRAEPSMHWWETYGRRLHLPPAQFGMHFITRTAALSYRGLRQRCPVRVDEVEAEFMRAAEPQLDQAAPNAVAVPLRLRAATVPNRLVSVVATASIRAPVPSGLVLVPADAPAASARVEATSMTVGVMVGRLHRAGREPLVATSPITFVEFECPAEPESGPTADSLVRQASMLRDRHVTGVLLRADLTREFWWDKTLRHASRVRTEAGLAVAVCVPSDWDVAQPENGRADTWPTRMHMALIAGRADLFVTWPMKPAELALATAGLESF